MLSQKMMVNSFAAHLEKRIRFSETVLQKSQEDAYDEVLYYNGLHSLLIW